MYNYDDLVEEILIDPKQPEKGSFTAKKHNYVELSEALSSDKANHALIDLVSSRILSFSGFTVRGVEPRPEDFKSFPQDLMNQISRSYWRWVNGETSDEPEKEEAKKK